MATVGQQLTPPEAGMRRVDDRDSNIQRYGASYNTGVYAGDGTDAGCSAGTYTQTYTGEWRFNFTGTSLSIIGLIAGGSYSTSVKIAIDGVESTYSQSGTTTYQALLYKVTGLSNTEHWVRIYNADTTKIINLDAVDIDSSGVVKPYNTTPVIEEPSQIFYGGM